MSEYILGTKSDELARLKLQHDLWKEEAVKLWKEAQFQPGQSLLDLGCGPGYTSMDLAQFLGPEGRLTAVDMSKDFLDFLESQAKNSARAQIDTIYSSVETLNLLKKDFDGAFCRWLMIFVPDCAQAIRSIGQHLLPGKNFALQEYVTYDSMALAPDSEIMKKVVNAIFDSWKDQGGDPNRGRILPTLLEKNGFKVKLIEPLARFARPTDPLWAWPDSFYRNFLPRLIQTGYLAQRDEDEFFATWNDIKNRPGSFFIAPTLINIVAEKI